mmetsp:Transcript_52647/g.149232  ORF Transcript_52647/g.149232 Transcript_52647/m.149232 type:complete len:318 (-) Transcript_52647:380-1333(-)
MSHEPFHAFSFDGIVGLGLDSLAISPEFSMFSMLSAQQHLQEASFGVFLAESDDEVSEISFGGHSPARVRGSLSWTPVVMPEEGHWMIQIKHLRIGDRVVDFCEDGTCRAVVDTGTSLLAVPVDFADELRADLEDNLKNPPLSAEGRVDCRQAEGLPVHFELYGGMTITLLPGDYARPTLLLADEEGEELAGAELAATGANATDAPALGANSSAGAAAVADAAVPEGSAESERADVGSMDDIILNACRPTIMPIALPEPIGPKLFIWGEPVLTKYYTVYHWGNKSVGFGIAAHANDEVTEQVAAQPAKPKRRPLLSV